MEFKTECNEKNLESLKELAESDFWIPAFLYNNEGITQSEELQSVPDADLTMPYLPQQSDYPSVGSVPRWMNSNQIISNLNSTSGATTGENEILPYSEEPSPVPSSTGSFGFNDFNDFAESFVSVEKQENEEQFKHIIARIGVTEQKLQQFGVKELNRFLKSNGLTKEEQQCLKLRRRTLKNRGYAQNCRIKRIKVKKSLESENESLREEVDLLRRSLAEAMKERDVYKNKLQKLINVLKKSQATK